MASLLGPQALLIERTHFLWDRFKPNHSVCCSAASHHFIGMWHYWSSFNMSLYCFLPLTLSILSLPYSWHPFSVSRWVELCCSRNHFCDGRLSKPSLHDPVLPSYMMSGISELDFQMGEGDYIYGMIWEMTGKVFYP